MRDPAVTRDAPTVDRAAQLKSQGYCGRKDPALLHRKLAAAPCGATGDDGAALARVTRALLAVPTSLVIQIRALGAEIAGQLARHADAHVFTSLPRSGTVCTGRLLAEIGDSRRVSPRAARLRNDAIARGKHHPHAARILARAWLYVIWHC
jgi:transposase